MGLRVGDEVTVIPADRDPYILQFQRYAKVALVLPSAAMVRLESTVPPGQEFGPIPFTRLLPGWRDEHGEWRRW